LALKGFLHDKGHTLEQLERMRHKLGELLELCKADGLALPEADTPSFVARFDKALVKARLRYDFDFDMPMLETARRVARGLLNDTKPTLPPLRARPHRREQFSSRFEPFGRRPDGPLLCWARAGGRRRYVLPLRI
jgi:hypothetical protein